MYKTLEVGIDYILTEKEIKRLKNILSREMKVSLDEVNFQIHMLDFEESWDMLGTGCLGYCERNKIFLATENKETLVHELVHVIQNRKTGFINTCKKKINSIANKKFNWLYKIDFNEREARRIASLFKEV